MKTDLELIAEFMGMKHNDGSDYWTIGTYAYQYDDLKFYATSWDWLMPVVEKIGKMTNDGVYNTELDIYMMTLIENPIENVYKAVVEFIKWYNSQAEYKR